MLETSLHCSLSTADKLTDKFCSNFFTKLFLIRVYNSKPKPWTIACFSIAKTVALPLHLLFFALLPRIVKLELKQDFALHSIEFQFHRASTKWEQCILLEWNDSIYPIIFIEYTVFGKVITLQVPQNQTIKLQYMHACMLWIYCKRLCPDFISSIQEGPHVKHIYSTSSLNILDLKILNKTLKVVIKL